MTEQLQIGSGSPPVTAGNHGAPAAAEGVGSAGPVVCGATSPRVAAGPAGAVSICELTREFTIVAWLCRSCQVLRSIRWGSVVELATFVRGFGRCDDCETRRQRAAGYVTPTVQAVQLGEGRAV